jgi:hypothetical protein
MKGRSSFSIDFSKALISRKRLSDPQQAADILASRRSVNASVLYFRISEAVLVDTTVILLFGLRVRTARGSKYGESKYVFIVA